MKYERVGWFVLAGFVSGVLSTVGIMLCFATDQIGLIGALFVPGLLFGLIIAYCITRIFAVPFIELILFIVFSALGHTVAVAVSLVISYRISHELGTAMYGMVFCGLLGAATLLIGFRYACQFNRREFIVLTLLGGILSYLYFLFPKGQYIVFGLNVLPVLGLYLVWQTSMATALGFVMLRRRN